MDTVNLTNHFLIAMPNMTDPFFARTLTYVCEHNANGALGIVINRPIEMTMGELFEQVGITLNDPRLTTMPIYFGGPVSRDRGFVLHRPLGTWQSTLAMNNEVGLTTSKDILQAVGDGHGPQQVMVTLGYAGWEAGQLEREMGQNAWLSVEADATMIFDLPWEDRMAAAMAKLGVNYASLSEEAGHA